ncbi:MULTISPECIES: hypothetical protein [unclassified Providencia]|uniref:hypothetical protein n=1 Tax=unclassified Providencia TaxID=2633465 RepID=UPI00109C9656|nr:MULTISPECIES: hypothetical protein [unclassified Providencia]THB27368.1 hypothetical protein E6R27_09000 [Providencia sp. MGF014]
MDKFIICFILSALPFSALSQNNQKLDVTQGSLTEINNFLVDANALGFNDFENEKAFVCGNLKDLEGIYTTENCNAYLDIVESMKQKGLIEFKTKRVNDFFQLYKESKSSQ